MTRDTLALGFALVWPSALTWLYFVVLGSASPAGEPDPVLQAAYGGGKLLQFAFPLAFLGLIRRQDSLPERPAWAQVEAVPGFQRKGLVLSVAFGVGVAAGILLVYFGFLRGGTWFQHAPEPIRARVEAFGLASREGYIALCLFLAGLHSFLEEYYWRWFVFGGLRRRLSFGPASGLSSLGFMAHHVIVLSVFFPGQRLAVVLFSLAVAGGGIVWCWLYERTGSLACPWLSHGIIDAAVMAVGYDLMFRA